MCKLFSACLFVSLYLYFYLYQEPIKICSIIDYVIVEGINCRDIVYLVELHNNTKGFFRDSCVTLKYMEKTRKQSIFKCNML